MLPVLLLLCFKPVRKDDTATAINVNIEQCQDRLIIISVQHGNYKLIIANVYAPNNSADKIAFFRTLHNALVDYRNHDVMILGDFNCVMNNTLDIVSGRPHARIEVERQVLSICYSYCMLDFALVCVDFVFCA